MQFVLALLLALLTLVTSAPTRRSLVPRACQTAIPTVLQVLDSAQPYNIFENQVSSFGGVGNFTIQEDNTNPNTPRRALQLVTFSIPPSSHTCTLYIADTLSSLSYTLNDTPSPPPTLNIISLTENVLALLNPSYASIFNANPPIIASNSFSTVTLARGDGARVLNSRGCPQGNGSGVNGRLGFVFEFMRGGGGGVDGGMKSLPWDGKMSVKYHVGHAGHYGSGSGSQGQGGGGMSTGQKSVWTLGQGAASSPTGVGSVLGLNGVYMTYNC